VNKGKSQPIKQNLVAILAPG